VKAIPSFTQTKPKKGSSHIDTEYPRGVREIFALFGEVFFSLLARIEFGKGFEFGLPRKQPGGRW
jgi:hypothetical protein